MMKLRNKLYVLTLAALLLNLLAACHATDPAEITDGPGDASDKPSQSQTLSGPEGPDVSEEPSLEPTPEPDLWDPEHRLEISFTPAKGLELPVSGATGYATVKLPLWEERPQEEEGKLATIYAPPEPIPEPAPEPSVEPSVEPAPEPPAETIPVPEPPADITPAPEEGQEAPGPAVDGSGAQAEASEPGTEGDAPPAETGQEEPLVTVEPPAEITAEPAPEPTAEPTPEPPPEPTPEPDPMEGALKVLEPGTAFTILRESGDWWQVRTRGGETGWVEHRYCLINLPDVVPSIVYNATNAYSSVFVSSGKTIPNITGKALYHGKEDNPRLGYKEFMMPVLYAMAKNVAQAQQNALAEGNTIVLYEGYRPYTAQMAVVRNLSALANKDSEVKAGISTAPWNISWFIATGSSNHQEGYAMDVSLAKVIRAHVGKIGGYDVVQVDEYQEYDMPTDIHELSMAAATYTSPVAIFSKTAWRTAEMAPAMAASQPARALQRYCTGADLTPLASEWWHFNDLAAYSQIRNHPSTGRYLISQCLSTVP